MAYECSSQCFIDDRSDYTGFSNEARASIQMTHSANGPKVSLEEAQRIERETAEHLLSTRRLSLIVDLDQTIVHATVDPTVGDWITEGEAWEARQNRNKAPSEVENGSNEPSQDEDDEVNPNWEALKDVKKFRLGPESFGLPPGTDKRRTKGKERVVETQGCLYYVKPRYEPVSCVVLALISVALKSRMAWLPRQCGDQV
jgi:RNA polymerase II subunit A C-terminal domain phosphatase